GVPSSVISLLLSILYLLASLYVYISLIYQISTRTQDASDPAAATRSFGLPEAILAALLILFLFLTIGVSVSQPSIQFSAPNLLANFLLTGCVVLVIITFLPFRGLAVGSLGRLFIISFMLTVRSVVIVRVLVYPLISLSHTMTQGLLGGGSSTQNIVEFFSGSRTILQRMMIIVFAVAIAPVVEEFLFPFFIFGVLRRY